MRVLHVVTARGGSKGLPGKNLLPVGPLPLLGYKIRAAQRARCGTHVIVSTDDPAIADAARALGADVPFLRPAALATDTASSDDVLRHATDWAERTLGPDAFDAVMLLQPSAPFATPAHLDAAAARLAEPGVRAVFGVRRVELPPAYVAPLEPGDRLAVLVRQVAAGPGLRRQDHAPVVTMNGSFFLLRWDAFRRTGARYADPDGTVGIVMDAAHSVDIDDADDLAYARWLVETGRVDSARWA